MGLIIPAVTPQTYKVNMDETPPEHSEHGPYEWTSMAESTLKLDNDSDLPDLEPLEDDALTLPITPPLKMEPSNHTGQEELAEQSVSAYNAQTEDSKISVLPGNTDVELHPYVMEKGPCTFPNFDELNIDVVRDSLRKILNRIRKGFSRQTNTFSDEQFESVWNSFNGILLSITETLTTPKNTQNLDDKGELRKDPGSAPLSGSSSAPTVNTVELDLSTMIGFLYKIDDSYQYWDEEYHVCNPGEVKLQLLKSYPSKSNEEDQLAYRAFCIQNERLVHHMKRVARNTEPQLPITAARRLPRLSQPVPNRSFITPDLVWKGITELNPSKLPDAAGWSYSNLFDIFQNQRDLLDMLAACIQACISQRRWPQFLFDVKISGIRTGNLDESFTQIATPSTWRLLIGKIFLIYFQKEFNRILPPFEFGRINSQGKMEMITLVQNIIDLGKARKDELVVCNLDLTQAFEHFPRKRMISMMDEIGITRATGGFCSRILEDESLFYFGSDHVRPLPCAPGQMVPDELMKYIFTLFISQSLAYAVRLCDETHRIFSAAERRQATSHDMDFLFQPKIHEEQDEHGRKRPKFDRGESSSTFRRGHVHILDELRLSPWMSYSGEFILLSTNINQAEEEVGTILSALTHLGIPHWACAFQLLHINCNGLLDLQDPIQTHALDIAGDSSAVISRSSKNKGSATDFCQITIQPRSSMTLLGTLLSADPKERDDYFMTKGKEVIRVIEASSKQSFDTFLMMTRLCVKSELLPLIMTIPVSDGCLRLLSDAITTHIVRVKPSHRALSTADLSYPLDLDGFGIPRLNEVQTAFIGFNQRVVYQHPVIRAIGLCYQRDVGAEKPRRNTTIAKSISSDTTGCFGFLTITMYLPISAHLYNLIYPKYVVFTDTLESVWRDIYQPTTPDTSESSEDEAGRVSAAPGSQTQLDVSGISLHPESETVQMPLYPIRPPVTLKRDLTEESELSLLQPSKQELSDKDKQPDETMNEIAFKVAKHDFIKDPEDMPDRVPQIRDDQFPIFSQKEIKDWDDDDDSQQDLDQDSLDATATPTLTPAIFPTPVSSDKSLEENQMMESEMAREVSSLPQVSNSVEKTQSRNDSKGTAGGGRKPQTGGIESPSSRRSHLSKFDQKASTISKPQLDYEPAADFAQSLEVVKSSFLHESSRNTPSKVTRQFDSEQHLIPPARSRVIGKLDRINIQHLESLQQKVDRSENWQQKKDVWARNIYLPFCDQLGWDPYPLTTDKIKAFFNFLAIECHYMLTSIQNAIYPALIRLHISAGFEMISETQRIQINSHFAQLRATHGVLKEGEGMEPLILADVRRIIQCIPRDDPDMALDASLFLFSLATGARAVSCNSIRLCDIRDATFFPDTGLTLVTINIPVGKANPTWNHPVALEGKLNELSTSNFVFWLNQHLIKTHGLTLQELVARNNSKTASPLTTKLWRLNEESMRTHLKSRAALAGYPPQLFGFHSLRSGMLCSSLIHADPNDEGKKAMFEKTAIVAGWTLGGKAQMKYVKSSMRRGVIATRLVGMSVDPSEGPGATIRTDLDTPEGFHGFKLKSPVVKVRHYPMVLRRALLAVLPVLKVSPEIMKGFYDSCWRSAVYYLGGLNQEPIQVPPDEETRSYKSNIRTHRGYSYISEQLHTRPAALEQMVEDCFNFLLSTERLQLYMKRALEREAIKGLDPAATAAEIQKIIINHLETPRLSTTPDEEGSVVTSGGVLPEEEEEELPKRRSRIPWTSEEEAELVRMVKSGMTFTAIAKNHIRDRKTIATHYTKMMEAQKAAGHPLPEPKRTYRIVHEPRTPLIQSPMLEDSDSEELSTPDIPLLQTIPGGPTMREPAHHSSDPSHHLHMSPTYQHYQYGESPSPSSRFHGRFRTRTHEHLMRTSPIRAERPFSPNRVGMMSMTEDYGDSEYDEEEIETILVSRNTDARPLRSSRETKLGRPSNAYPYPYHRGRKY